jgi:hypothetical protein
MSGLPRFEPRFDLNRVRELAERFLEENGDDKSVERIGLRGISRGWINKEELMKFVQWKAGGRNNHHADKNSPEFVREVSQVAFKTSSEQLRIETLTLLDGVSWPTASTILHFAFPGLYPILDFRALWSLKAEQPNQYTFPFWDLYTRGCRQFATIARVDMRTLDRALWQYSSDHQGVRTS